MFRKVLFILFAFVLILSLITPAPVTSFAQEEEPSYCEMYPEYCEPEEGTDGGSGETWDGYTDGRLNPDQAEYYTIYCHPGTDTIYVVRVVPETQTIKQIPLIDAISLAVGGEQTLGDFMVMQRSSEDTITIWGSNGNLAPEPGSKAFSLSECIAHNGGAPASSLPASESSDDTPAEAAARRRREADEAIDFCYDSYAFFQDSALLVDCLDYALATYPDVLSGDEILSLIVMVFCLNLIAGNGVLPIGIVLFLGWHRRWLRKLKSLK